MDNLFEHGRRESEEEVFVTIKDVQLERNEMRCVMGRGGESVSVICGAGKGGIVSFSEQRPNEVRWFSFSPSPEELKALYEALREALKVRNESKDILEDLWVLLRGKEL